MSFPLHLESTHRRSKVLEKIRNGQVARFCNIGHYLPFAVAWAAKHGFDGIWLDAEHRAFDPRELQAMLAQAVAADIDVMVRCPYRTERTMLYRFFEDGAAGLMFPLTDTREMAEHVVRSVKFPPIGNRGHDGAEAEAGFGTAVWGGGKTNVANYIASANAETFVIVQIETPEAVSNLEAIISTPGLDGVFVGPGDLGLRLDIENEGKPASEQMSVMDVVEMVAQLCKKHGKAWGIPCGDAEAVAMYSEMGGQLLNLGGEFMSVMKTWEGANNDFDRVLGEAYGPFKTPTPPAEAAAALIEARLSGNNIGPSDAPRVASTEQAYAVQRAMLAMAKDAGLGALWGWKTGVAPLFACGKWASGAVLSCPGLKISAIEGEVGLTFKDSLPPKSSPYTAEEIWAAVGSGALCIEVCRSSYSGGWTPNEFQALADVNNNAGVVVGQQISAETAREAAEGVEITISADGQTLVQSVAVSGGVDPIANIVTLVNDLSSQGITLEAGQLVITGAIAVTKAMAQGQKITVAFAGIGEVTCVLGGMELSASL